LRSAGSGEACAPILAELPQWFAIPQSNAHYARLAKEGPAFVALAAGRADAIMILKPHFDTAIEIYLLVVRPNLHRRGVACTLIEQASSCALARGARYLTVKTLGPSQVYEPYERTRAFYLALGFPPLEEFTQLWGPENPSLLMVRPVAG
jgi:GNAT superfamily N-acetyltransferase